MAARPLVGAAFAFLAGVALGAWLPQGPAACLAAAGCALALWAMLLGAGRTSGAGRVGFAALLLAGAARAQVDLAPVFSEGSGLAEGDAVVAGTVESGARRGRDQVLVLGGARLRRGGTTLAPAETVQLILEEDAGPYRIGERLVARGRVATIRGDRNLGWFPRPAATRGRRHAARVIVSSPLWVRREGREAERSPGAVVLHWRERASANWRTLGGQAAILDALTTGERADIPRETEEAFFRSGLTHLLAISGMNVGFLATLVFVALRHALASWERLALRWPVQPLAAAATAPFLWFFQRFSGGQIPVGRAAVMAAAGLAAVILWRRIDAGDACALAALLFVAWDPRALLTPSFQLSFAAVAALVLVAPRIPRRPEEGEGRGARLVRQARGLLLVSLAAGAATAPLVAFHFQQAALVGPVANLVAVPYTGFLVLPAAWVGMLAMGVGGWVGEVGGGAAAHLASGLIDVATFFAEPGWASLRVPRPPAAVACALAALVAALLHRSTVRIRRMRAAACAAVVLSCGWWAIALRRDELRAVFFDVGQGMAAAVLLPRGGAMLVDAGPRWRDGDAGRVIVGPGLRKLGARSIDVLALTHAHPDHDGGAPSILREFAVGQVWVGARAGDGGGGGPAASEVPETRPGRAGLRLASGDELTLRPGLAVRVLNPSRSGGVREIPRGDGENERSLALRLTWGSTGLLLTGDAGPAEAREIADGAPTPPGGMVLQAPHHGSSRDACRVLSDALQPRFSVICVGRNSYGHPRAEAVAELERAGEVLRTDRDGAVFLASDGRRWRARTWGGLASSRSWAERVRWLFEGW